MKQILMRFLNGFCYSIAITMVVQLIVMRIAGALLLLPDYLARFADPVTAFGFQLLLIGVMSGVTSAGAMVFELKKVGLLVQSVIFLAIMLCAWIPVACILWGFHRYPASMISTIGSLVLTYAICWGIQYAISKREIEQINGILREERD